MSPTAKALFGLALVFLLMSIAIDFLPVKEVTDLDGFARYEGSDPWAVSQVRPGELLEQHLTRLGTPERDNKMGSIRVIRWISPRDVTLSVDSEGRIFEVLGNAVTAGNQSIVGMGHSRAEIERVLGKGKVSTERRPSGSGVISLGWDVVSKTLTYENQGVRFDINLQEDRVRYVRATSLSAVPNAPRPR